MAIYWQVKSLLGKILLASKEDQNELLLQADEMKEDIRKLDREINILVKSTIELETTIRAPKMAQGHGVPMISKSDDDPTSYNSVY